MYLEKLEIENFRSFAKATIPLNENLTVLVGENNGGTIANSTKKSECH